MSNHPIMEETVYAYAGFLIALGEIGFGWLLAFHSQSMVSYFSSGKKSKFSLLARILAISGWICLVGGFLSVAMFLIAAAIALGSLWF